MANVIELIFKAVDQASGTIEKLKGELESLNSVSTAGGGKGSAITDPAALAQIQSQLPAATLGWKEYFAVAAAGFASVMVAAKAAQAAWRLMMEGADTAGTIEMTSKLATAYGTSGKDLINTIRAATHGLTTEKEAAYMANRSMILGIDTGSKEMARLAAASAFRARALGRDVSSTYDMMVRSITSLSPRQMSVIGLIVDSDTAYASYAARVGLAVKNLTQQQKVEATLQETLLQNDKLMSQSGGFVVTPSMALQRSGVSPKSFWEGMWANMAENAGALLMTDSEQRKWVESLGAGAESFEEYNKLLNAAQTNGWTGFAIALKRQTKEQWENTHAVKTATDMYQEYAAIRRDEYYASKAAAEEEIKNKEDLIAKLQVEVDLETLKYGLAGKLDDIYTKYKGKVYPGKKGVLGKGAIAWQEEVNDLTMGLLPADMPSGIKNQIGFSIGAISPKSFAAATVIGQVLNAFAANKSKWDNDLDYHKARAAELIKVNENIKNSILDPKLKDATAQYEDAVTKYMKGVNLPSGGSAAMDIEAMINWGLGDVYIPTGLVTYGKIIWNETGTGPKTPFKKTAEEGWTNEATGGPVSAGGLYIVGEEGPELFVPNNSGTIIPNNKIKKGGSAGQSFKFFAPVTFKVEGGELNMNKLLNQLAVKV